MKPPVAKQQEYFVENFGDKLLDNYHWLRDNKWPDVQDTEILNYIKAENDYTEHVMRQYKKQQDELFEELKAKIIEDDETVPIKKGNYYYYQYIKSGMSYWVHARKYKTLAADVEILLDENKLAQDKNHLNVAMLRVSEDHNILAYAVDYGGDERYDIIFKNLETGSIVDTIHNTMGYMVWDNEGKGVFYIPASKNWRAEKILYHALGSQQEDDKLIYEEPDHIYSAWCYKSSDKKYLFLGSSSKDNNSIYYIDLAHSLQKTSLIIDKKLGYQSSISSKGDDFYLRINDTGKNFRLVKTKINSPHDHWQEVISHKEDIYLIAIAVYKDFYAIATKEDGLPKITLYDNNDHMVSTLTYPDDIPYVSSIIYTAYEDNKIRYLYGSLNQPIQVMEFSLEHGSYTILKEKKIPGFQQDKYELKRIFAVADDGTKIPVSILYRHDLFKNDGSNPLYLNGYGSYGHAMPMHFRANILSLVDRGFVFALAHIRGGDEMGYHWYEQARLLNKKLTFTDFITVSEYLIAQKYTRANNIVISGGSAGGMLIAACINMRPELFNTAIADVPFVDVLNTMLDDSLPLTPGEFKEWGNPKDKEFYHYIKSYSPYENIVKQDYPHILATAGLTDPRVTYWEPAKWVAKLRQYKTDDNLLLLKTNMAAGHSGKSGRFDYLKDVALEYSFILKNFGLIRPQR